MSRPAVSVVVPFAGTREQAVAVFSMLGALNRPRRRADPRRQQRHRAATDLALPPQRAALRAVRADAEASASHARNVGAAAARNDWILFLDSDVIAPADLLDSFFAEPIGERVGAVTGDIAGIPDTRTLAARYGTARNFLGQRSHVNNPVPPARLERQPAGPPGRVRAGRRLHRGDLGRRGHRLHLAPAGRRLDARVQRARRRPARLPHDPARTRQAVARLRGRRPLAVRALPRLQARPGPEPRRPAAAEALRDRPGRRLPRRRPQLRVIGAADPLRIACSSCSSRSTSRSRSRSACACPTRSSRGRPSRGP